MSLIAAKLQANPLYGVENQEVDEEKNVKNYRKRVGKDLFKSFHLHFLTEAAISAILSCCAKIELSLEVFKFTGVFKKKSLSKI